ncbi:MAG: DNRLRE domain-containing protein [Paenibacillaceae bacterium]|nr:DNRLRE domain-containing protein [Paenibacillaceae bacterium]
MWKRLGMVLGFLLLIGVIGGGTALAYGDVSNMTDEELFGTSTMAGRLNLDYPDPGMETVRDEVEEAYVSHDYADAKIALMNYFHIKFDAGTNDKLVPISAERSVTYAVYEQVHRFAFLGQTVDIDDPGDPDMSTSPVWDNPLGPPEEGGIMNKTWYRHLSRFAYARTMTSHSRYERSHGNVTAADAAMNNLLDLQVDFIQDKGNAETSYGLDLQTAIRLMNWSAVFPFQLESAAADAERMTAILKYMIRMADYTADPVNFLGNANNRGFFQTKALHQMAIYFPELYRSTAWESQAIVWANEYVAANIYKNGALGEPTTGYHAGQVIAVYNMQKLAENFSHTALDPANIGLIDRMINYYMDTVSANSLAGQRFLIGDSEPLAGFGGFNDLAEETGREDLAYVASYGASGTVPGHTSAMYDHGVAVMRSGWAPGAVAALVENEPAGNHSHPDDLSFNLMGYGAVLLSNSGKKTYDNADAEANFLDSETESNNTVQIDGRPQKGYVFGERTTDWVTQPQFDFYSGEYRDARPRSIPPTDDAYIQGGTDADAKELNFAAAGGLYIRNQQIGTERTEEMLTYLKFRPGIVRAPLGATNSVYFHYYMSSAALENPVTLQFYGLANDNWNQSNITWNDNSSNHAANDAAFDPASSGAVYLGSQTVYAQSWYHFTSPALISFIADQVAAGGDGAATIMIEDATGSRNKVILSSKEGVNRPSLELFVGDPAVPFDDVITHERTVYFDKTNLFFISDRLTGAANEHQYEQVWNFGADRFISGGTPTVAGNKSVAEFVYGGSSDAFVQVAAPAGDSFDAVSLVAGKTSKQSTKADDPELVENNHRVLYKQHQTGTATFDTVVLASEGGSAANLLVNRLAISPDDRGATALEAFPDGSGGDQAVYYLADEPAGLRSFNNASYGLEPQFNYSFDSKMTAIRRSNAGAVQTIGLRNGSRLIDNVAAKTLVSSPVAIGDLAIDYRTAGTLSLVSSEPLKQELSLYSAASIATITFNGETICSAATVACTGVSGMYTIGRAELFYSDFDSGFANGWTSNTDTWSVNRMVTEAKLENSGATGLTPVADATYTAGNPDWSDLVVEAKVTLAQAAPTSKRIGLLARYADAHNYYGFIYDPTAGKLRIVKEVNGTRSTIAQADYTFHRANEYTFKAVLNGTSLSFYVGGALVLSGTDSSRASGVIGLIADAADVSFDDVSVTGASAAAAAASHEAQALELVAAENAYIGDNSPDTNLMDHFFGDSDARLVTRDGTTTNPHRISYVKFELDANDGHPVSAAKLRLYGNVTDFGKETATAVTVSVYGISNHNWNDRQLVWTDPDMSHSQSDSIPEGAGYTSIGTIAVKNPGWYDIDITDYINAHLDDSSVSFMLLDATDSGKKVEFYSNVYVLKPYIQLNNTFVATEDALVKSSKPGVNYGTSEQLNVVNQSPDDDQLSYLKFHLAAYPAGRTVRNATLHVTGAAPTTGSPVTVSVYGLDTDSWTEGGIKWNNSPNHDAFGAIVTGGGATFLGTIVIGQYGEYVLSNSPLLDRFLQSQVDNAADKTATFLLVDPVNGTGAMAAFDSREGRNKPFLVLNEHYEALDDFNDGDSSGWSNNGIAGVSWNVVADGGGYALQNSSGAASGMKAYWSGEPAVANMTVEADVKVSSWNSAGKVGLLARYVNNNSHYFMYYDNDVQKVVIAKRTPSGNVQLAASGTLSVQAAGVYHRFKFKVSGSTLNAYLDGELVASVSGEYSIPSGYAGVFANGQIGTFDNVNVWYRDK